METVNNWEEAVKMIRRRQRRKDMELIKNQTIFYGIMAAPFVLCFYTLRKAWKTNKK